MVSFFSALFARLKERAHKLMTSLGIHNCVEGASFLHHTISIVVFVGGLVAMLLGFLKITHG